MTPTLKESTGPLQVEYVETESYIGYTSEPPALQNIALISVAVKLWTDPDIKEGVMHYSERFGFDSGTRSAIAAYNEVEEKVLQKLENALLPNFLKCKVSNIIQPIGFQLFKCFAKEIEEKYSEYEETFHSENKIDCRFYDIFKIGGAVYFTMDGVIDNVKSLKELFNDESQKKDCYYLYELACKYCVEEHISDLWRNISPGKKNDLGYIYKNYDYHIIAYWTASLENRLLNLFKKIKQSDDKNIYDNNLSIEQNMISLSIFLSNPYSLRYFWYKLKDEERYAYLENWLTQSINKYTPWEIHEYQNCSDKTNILCFLLSQLNDKNQQKEAFRAHSKIILKALFFDWPWQRFFLPTINTMLDYIAEEDFVEIMSLIADKIIAGENIVIIFREIWCKSQMKLKKSLIHFLLEDSINLIYRFLKADDVETIFMVLDCASTNEQKQILFEMIKSYELVGVISSNRLSLIETLVRKYLPSNQDINNFKKCVMLEYSNDLCCGWINDNNFRAVETFLEWGCESPQKIQTFNEQFIDKNKLYGSLVCLGDYELVKKFMSWYFKSEDEIHEFKKTFLHEVDEDDSSVCSNLLWELSCHVHGWDLFEKFISYNCVSPEEVSQFKKDFRECVTSFLDSYRFEFADKFVNWCLGSVEEGNRYKNFLALSKKGSQLILRMVNKGYPIWSHANKLIKWFSITKETAAELKRDLDNIELFSEYCSDAVADFKRQGFLYLLDKHLVDDKMEVMEDSENGESIESEVMEMVFKRNEKGKF